MARFCGVVQGAGMKHLYFVRHGLSEMNKTMQWSGHTDTPLAPEGHKQAQKAGKHARKQGMAFDLIISSPLQRAHHTAQHVATHTEYNHDNIVLHDLFKERHFGDLEGVRSLVISTKYLLDESCIDDREGVEPLATLHARAQQAYSYLQSLPQDTVLVVSHGAFGRALYRAVNDLPMHYRDVRYRNAEIVKFI